jgi:hypothetical protein
LTVKLLPVGFGKLLKEDSPQVGEYVLLKLVVPGDKPGQGIGF